MIPALALLCVMSVQAQQKKAPAKPAASASAANPLKSNRDSASYAIGIGIARNLQAQSLDSINIAMLYKGLNDALHKKAVPFSDDVAGACINTYVQKVSGEKALGNKIAGQKFCTANAKRKEVKSLPDGLQYEVIKTGTDTTRPKLISRVKCHYHGTLLDGTVFDSSVDRGEPATFMVNEVIQGWQEVLLMMTVGSKWKVYLPSSLAYGDRGSGKIGPGATLIFDIELLGVEK